MKKKQNSSVRNRQSVAKTSKLEPISIPAAYCQWLQQLHSYGLLSGSFRPEDKIC